MASNYETFWQRERFAVVGDTEHGGFPVLTYRGLKQLGKKVFPIDPSAREVDGDTAYADLASLPEPVDAVVLEVPRERTRDWVAMAAEAGVEDVWIHQGRETTEALGLAGGRGMNVRTGTCAVMYLTPGFTYHSIHRWAMKLANRY